MDDLIFIFFFFLFFVWAMFLFLSGWNSRLQSQRNNDISVVENKFYVQRQMVTAVPQFHSKQFI